MPLKHEPIKVTIQDLFQGYEDQGDSGAVAFGGNLVVRPPLIRGNSSTKASSRKPSSKPYPRACPSESSTGPT